METPTTIKRIINNNPWIWALIIGSTASVGITSWFYEKRIDILNQNIELLEDQKSNPNEIKEIPLQILQKQFDISKKIYELTLHRGSVGLASLEDIIKAHQDLIDSELALEGDDGLKRLILVNALKRIDGLKEEIKVKIYIGQLSWTDSLIINKHYNEINSMLTSIK